MTESTEHSPRADGARPSGRPRLRRKEAALHLERVHGIPMAPATLAKYATIGGGPKYQKSGRTPLYPIEWLNRWATERLGKLISSSSEERMPPGRSEERDV